MSTQLTAEQAKIVTREIEFSVNTSMRPLIAAFPSVEFVRGAGNGGVTTIYKLTGPAVWLDKIERRYAY